MKKSAKVDFRLPAESTGGLPCTSISLTWRRRAPRHIHSSLFFFGAALLWTGNADTDVCCVMLVGVADERLLLVQNIGHV